MWNVVQEREICCGLERGDSNMVGTSEQGAAQPALWALHSTLLPLLPDDGTSCGRVPASFAAMTSRC